jgi:hypothetical protein
VGIALALVLLAPVLNSSLNDAVDDAKLKGAALILDAKLPPQDKLDLAPQLAGAVQSDHPRDDLDRAFDAYRPKVDEGDRDGFDELRRRADETLVSLVDEGFAIAFAIGAAFALLAALLLWRGLPGTIAIAGIVTAIGVSGAFALVAEASRPPPVEIADPCKKRDLPGTGGILGFVQDAALVALDRAACSAGSSREELVLALGDDAEADRYERRYGLDPRSVLDLVRAALGGG